ncbi:MAG TPA: galactosyltransferase-related protein [Kribbella sp.]|jgi:GT2 family glycosyltransferase
MRTAVITTVHGRGDHLRRQIAGLQLSNRPTDMHIVVALGDPTVQDVVASAASSAIVIDCRNANDELPVAQGRNVGAAAALHCGAELLVFLDVDCIPAAALIGRYHHAATHQEHAQALLCGPVTYLPPPAPGGYALNQLTSQINPHPGRPAPAGTHIVTSTDYTLFWSLSFAVSAATWKQIGGFCELYRGYGGEDTDFAQSAAAAGVTMRWVGGADAFHQYHPVSDPPVEHIDDILRNTTLFHQRWGWWPMQGWLREFENRGLIQRGADGQPHRLSAGTPSGPDRAPTANDHRLL